MSIDNNVVVCMKCEGWGCTWCNSPVKTGVMPMEEPPDDEPLTKEQAVAVLNQVDKVLVSIEKKLDLLRELRLIAMNVLGEPVKMKTRLLHRCNHCGGHDHNEMLLSYQGQHYHKHICWRGLSRPFILK